MKNIQKIIRFALPWVCLAVIIFGGNIKWLIGVVGIGAVSYAVLYMKLHKIQNQLKAQAEEAIAPELEKVKGNWLKKDMIKRRLLREYINKKNSDDYSNENKAVENIKGWLGALKRFFFIIFIIVLALIILLILFYTVVSVLDLPSDRYHVPAKIDYHNADDLRKATGVEFPEIVPVDSIYSDGGLAGYNTNIKFIPVKPLDKDFFCRLDQACKTDSCCWKKDSTGYRYDIYPEAIPFDRTKGMHWRMVDVDGKKVPDWDGTYISVFVPIKGDTIILNDGWTR